MQVLVLSAASLDEPIRSLGEGIAAWRGPVAAVTLLSLLLWESVQPYIPLFRGPGAFAARARHGATNLAFGAFNGLLLRFVFLGLWMGAMQWTQVHGGGLLAMIGDVRGARWIISLLALDAWTYAWHRINHRVRFLWRFHRVHHGDSAMDVTTANRFHPGEIVLSSLARVPILVTLGCRLEELAVYETVLFAVVQLQHANVAFPEQLDRVLRTVIVTPHLHKVHHSIDVAEQNSNFSSLLSWWDRVARTFRVSSQPTAIRFGVESETN